MVSNLTRFVSLGLRLRNPQDRILRFPDLCRSPMLWKRNSATAADAEKCLGSSDELCLVSIKDGIKRIVLNNPKKRNALSLDMMLALHKNILDDMNVARVIIISSSGPVFSSGHDLKELQESCGTQKHEEVFRTASRLMCAVEDSPVPVIAQVNGLAAAAGCQLVASCDLVVASSNSQFSTPGVNNGLFCSTPGIPLVRAVSKKIATKMLLTGDPISAQEALQCGLISNLVEEGQVEEETLRLAKRILEKSPAVVAVGKAFLRAQCEMDRTRAYSEGEKVMVKNLGMSDGQEGIRAFIEKRKPQWTK